MQMSGILLEYIGPLVLCPKCGTLNTFSAKDIQNGKSVCTGPPYRQDEIDNPGIKCKTGCGDVFGLDDWLRHKEVILDGEPLVFTQLHRNDKRALFRSTNNRHVDWVNRMDNPNFRIAEPQALFTEKKKFEAYLKEEKQRLEEMGKAYYQAVENKPKEAVVLVRPAVSPIAESALAEMKAEFEERMLLQQKAVEAQLGELKGMIMEALGKGGGSGEDEAEAVEEDTEGGEK